MEDFSFREKTYEIFYYLTALRGRLRLPCCYAWLRRTSRTGGHTRPECRVAIVLTSACCASGLNP